MLNKDGMNIIWSTANQSECFNWKPISNDEIFASVNNNNKLLMNRTESWLFYSNKSYKTHINIKFSLSWKVPVSSKTQGVIVLNIHLFNYQRLEIFW